MGERAEADLFGESERQGFDERADRASGIGRHAVEIERKSIKPEIRQRMYKHFFKRFMDIVISLLALIVLSPLLLILAIAVKIDSPGPVVFKQQRIGRKGKVFNIYKFRSMCVGAEKIGSGVYSGKGDKRVTKVGNFLRKTSADELLQLVNILKGDMSLIGPRPPLTYHPWPYEQYTEEQKRMFEVRPGITGWAQVNGRKEVEWHKRIELNVWYVEHLSFWLDIKIFFMTIFKVFSNADNENTGATVTVDLIPGESTEEDVAGKDHDKSNDSMGENEEEKEVAAAENLSSEDK